MGKFSTLATAVSGMNAAQAGLYVTGHNMANSNTVGYSRQRVLQQDFFSPNIGFNGIGLLQIGLGTDVAGIRQIRDRFLDMSYRAEAGKFDFYYAKTVTGSEIENIIGELQSQYSTDSVIKDLWDALNELSIDPSSIAARGTFVSTAITFIDKVNNVYDRLYEYQFNLNEQIKQTVTRINQLVKEIDRYNVLIMQNEITMDRANDFRDARNLCLDELSHLLDIDYTERPNGRIDIMAHGNELLVNGVISKLGLRQTSAAYPFVEPVFTSRQDILDFGEDAKPLFRMTGQVSSNLGNDKGKLWGLMVSRGLYPADYTQTTEFRDPPVPPPSVVRPSVPARPRPPVAPDPADYAGGAADPQYILDYDQYVLDNDQYLLDYDQYLLDYDQYLIDLELYNQYASDKFEYDRWLFNSTQCVIPKVMMELDTIVHKIVTMINNAVAPYATDADGNMLLNADGNPYMDPNAPYDLNYDNTRGFEIFVRKYADRFDANGVFNVEDTDDVHSLYSIGNIRINPLLLDADGYNLIALMMADGELDQPGGVSDNRTVLNDLLDKWKSKIISFNGREPMSVDDAYRYFVTNIATETRESINFTDQQEILLQQVDFKRSAISGVSLDEEMKNMMIYQHAYNASARMVNTIDSMIDRIVNGTGRVGR